MKIRAQFLLPCSLLLVCASGLTACGNKRADHAAGDSSVYGTVTVPLPWNSINLRKGEVTTGDFVTDAMMDYVIAHNYTADFAIQNGGGIRGPSDNSGIFPAGGWTGTMIHDLLPLGNVLMIVRTTGAELKSLFERAASAYVANGNPFFQISHQLKVVISTSQTVQILNGGKTAVLTEGSCVTSMTLNGVPINPAGTYYIATNDFLSTTAPGGSGCTSGLIAWCYKSGVGDRQAIAIDLGVTVQEYLARNSPVTPVVEGRIVIGP